MKNALWNAVLLITFVLLSVGCDPIEFEHDETDTNADDDDTTDTKESNTTDSSSDLEVETDSWASDNSPDTEALTHSLASDTDPDTAPDSDLNSAEPDIPDYPGDCTPAGLGASFPASGMPQVYESLTMMIEETGSGGDEHVKGYGFNSVAELKQSSLGKPYRNVDAKLIAKENGEKEAKLTITDIWLFPVMANGTMRCFLEGDYSSGKWEFHSFGEPAVAEWFRDLESRIGPQNIGCLTGYLNYDGVNDYLIVNHEDGSVRVYPTQGRTLGCDNYPEESLYDCSYSLEDLPEHLASVTTL